MRLRAGLAAIVVLGLGGSIAPGYAKDTLPVLATAAAPITDPTAIAPALSPSDATDDQAGSWRSVGGGMASWYGNELAGHRTANGERFNPNELTAANRTLPLGTHVRVTYQGRSVVVRINDRGPFSRHRVIDLSRAAAELIGLRRAGSGRVTMAVLDSTPVTPPAADQANVGDQPASTDAGQPDAGTDTDS